MKFFLSDLHLGCGDALEDFVLYPVRAGNKKSPDVVARGMKRMHKAFAKFIDFALDKSRSDGSPAHLIFLGDTFDLLQVLPQERTNPKKIDIIASAHRPFFDALTHFHKKGGSVHLICGNHDYLNL